MDMKEIELKIAQLKNVLDFKGYHGQVHINGIEQGTLEQVIQACFALKDGGRTKDFKDPVVMSHFSENESDTGFLVAKFVLELESPERFKIGEVTFESYDRNLGILAVRKMRPIQNMSIPSIKRARLMFTHGNQKSRINKGKGL